MTNTLEMPDGVVISRQGYNHAEQVVWFWMTEAEHDVNYLALIVSLCAHVQSNGQSQPSKEDRELISKAGLPWPLDIEFKVATRNCLQLNEMRNGFRWVRPASVVNAA